MGGNGDRDDNANTRWALLCSFKSLDVWIIRLPLSIISSTITTSRLVTSPTSWYWDASWEHESSCSSSGWPPWFWPWNNFVWTTIGKLWIGKQEKDSLSSGSPESLVPGLTRSQQQSSGLVQKQIITTGWGRVSSSTLEIPTIIIVFIKTNKLRFQKETMMVLDQTKCPGIG